MAVAVAKKATKKEKSVDLGINTQLDLDPSSIIDPESFYKRFFSPGTTEGAIRQQIISLCKILNINWPGLEDLNSFISFPDNGVITGFAVVLNPYSEGFGKEEYSSSLQKLIKIISKKGTRIQNEMAGQIVGNFQTDPFTEECLKTCPSCGSFRIFPISTGHRWAKTTALDAKTEMQKAAANDGNEWIEFPISLFDCLCLFASYGEEMIQRDSILPLCSGDLFKPNENGVSSYIPMIDCDDSGRKIRLEYNQHTYGGTKFGHQSTWTGFVKRNP